MSQKPRGQVSSEIVPIEQIADFILFLRGQKVILDGDLAKLYGVTTKRLNEQVRRNTKRFPGDFIFHLSHNEKSEVVAKCDHLCKLKYSSVLPYAFTEHGAVMAASVLNTKRAIEVSVFVVRAFVKLRQILTAHKELADKLSELESKVSGHDEAIKSLVITIRQLMAPPGKPRKRLGFLTN